MSEPIGGRSSAPPDVPLGNGAPRSRPVPAVEGPVAVSVAGHDLTLFVESGPLIASMVRDIRRARTRVWLETYIFHNDSAGQAVAEALIDRARAGVQVRVLYDAIGSQATPRSFFREMYQAGIEVHEFHSLWEALWKFSFLRILNRRDHRKLLVIDHQADVAQSPAHTREQEPTAVAYFGGMNIVDTASVPTVRQAEHLPSSAGWRDVHVRLVGPKQAEVAESFDRSWRRAHGEKVPPRPRPYRLARLSGGEESIQFFDSGPGLRHTRAARLFLRLIRAARRRITLSMAYFLPVGDVLRALLRAPRRGVLIRVVVPGESDVPLVQHATRHLYPRLLRRRFRVYERQGIMLHSKVMVVDRSWVLVGSCNLDARSLWINLEFLAVIHSRRLARVVDEIIAYEVDHSHRITFRDYQERNWWRRLVNRLAWSLRWWL
jgi:cardiolipin synthase